MFINYLLSNDVLFTKNNYSSLKNNLMYQNKRQSFSFGKKQAENTDIYYTMAELRQQAQDAFVKNQEKIIAKGKSHNATLQDRINGLKIERDREIEILLGLDYPNDIIVQTYNNYNKKIAELAAKI